MRNHTSISLPSFLRTPHHTTRIKELNHIAGEIILDGMLAYGWAKEDVIDSDSRLRSALATHCPDLLCTTSTLSSSISAPELDLLLAIGASDNFTFSSDIANVGSAESSMPLVASYDPHMLQGPTSAGFSLETNVDFSEIPNTSFLACESYFVGDHSHSRRQDVAFLGNVEAHIVSTQSDFPH